MMQKSAKNHQDQVVRKWIVFGSCSKEESDIVHTEVTIAPFSDRNISLEVSKVINGLVSWSCKTSSNGHNFFGTDLSQLTPGLATVHGIYFASLRAGPTVRNMLTVGGKETNLRNGLTRLDPLAVCKKY